LRRNSRRTVSPKAKRTHLLSTPGNSTLDTTETRRVAFIRIDFLTDRGGGASTGDGKFDLTRPGSAAPPIDRPPRNRDFYTDHHPALANYYDVQTYGRVKITGEVWPRDQDLSYHLSDMADLGPWKFGPDIFPAAVHMFRTMCFAADSQSIVMGDRI